MVRLIALRSGTSQVYSLTKAGLSGSGLGHVRDDKEANKRDISYFERVRWLQVLLVLECVLSPKAGSRQQLSFCALRPTLSGPKVMLGLKLGEQYLRWVGRN